MWTSVAIFPLWIKIYFCIKIRIILVLKFLCYQIFFICYPSYKKTTAQVQSLAWPICLFIFLILVPIVNTEFSGPPAKSQLSLQWDVPSVCSTYSRLNHSLSYSQVLKLYAYLSLFFPLKYTLFLPEYFKIWSTVTSAWNFSDLSFWVYLFPPLKLHRTEFVPLW